jgi:hypothetical protein
VEEAARELGLDAARCGAYRFDLALRRLVSDGGKSSTDVAAMEYVRNHFGTPGLVMDAARLGRFSKGVLMELLEPSARAAYEQACATIERRYTESCGTSGDTCLADGCASEGERCLEPLLRSAAEYQKECGAEWVRLFSAPEHRVASWTH